jgi:hypothetical protein
VTSPSLGEVGFGSFSRKIGPDAFSGVTNAYEPGKSYMTGLSNIDQSYVEPDVVKKDVAYQKSVLAGTYRYPDANIKPVKKAAEHGSAMGIKKINPNLGNLSQYPDVLLSPSQLTPPVIPDHTGKMTGARKLSQLKEGDYNLVVGANLQHLLDSGYLEQAYSDEAMRGRNQSIASKMAEVRKTITLFRQTAAMVQKMRRDPSVWMDPKSGYQEMYRKMEMYKRAALPIYSVGSSFRKKALLTKYGDPSLIGKFGFNVGPNTGKPAEYSKSYMQAQKREAVEGPALLTPKQLKKLFGDHAITSTFGLNELKKTTTKTTAVSGAAAKKEGEDAFRKYIQMYLKKMPLADKQPSDYLKYLEKLNTGKKPIGVPIKHQGGVADHTGLYYLEGGEVIIPHKYSTGGPPQQNQAFEWLMQNTPPAAQALNNNNNSNLNSSTSDIVDKIGQAVADSMKDVKVTAELSKDTEVKIDGEKIGESIATQMAKTKVEFKLPEKDDLTLKVDTESLSQAGSSIGDNISEAIQTSIKDVEFPEVKVDKSSFENVVVEAKVKDPVEVKVAQQQSEKSVGADKALDQAVEKLAEFADITDNIKAQLADAADKLNLLNEDVGHIKDNTIDRDEAARIAESSVNASVGKLEITLNNHNSALESNRSQLAQLTGKVSHIDEKYDFVTNNLRSQTHFNNSNNRV